MLTWPRLALAALLLARSAPAEALCIYKGVDNARTSVGQEYIDSRWVIRASLLSATNGEIEAGKPDAGMPWTLYRLRVVHSYKGNPPQRIVFFTMRNSGGFYMDRPLPRGHDIGGEYLLFLNPIAAYPGQPRAERGATFVNYSCGQSRPWREVSAGSRRLLTSLSARR